MDLLLDGAIFGLQRSGGISRCWADLLLQLDQSSYSVTLLLPSNHNIEWRAISTHLQHIRLIHRKRFRWNRTSLWQERLYLTAICTWYRPRIWHASYYVGQPITSIPSIISYHDMIAERTGSTDTYTHRAKRATLEQSTHILSPSHHAKADLLDVWPHLSQPISVIPHGFTPRSVEEVFPSFPYFIYLGRREGYKSFQPTVEEILRDSRWSAYHIVALGGEEQPTFMHPRVHYLGTRPHAEVLGWLQKATLLLMPSSYEGFGYPILEAFSLGTPVVARRCSSIPEITGSDYPLWDHQPISAHMHAILQNRDHWVAYGYAQAKLFLPKMSWSHYDTLYRALMS